MREKNKDSTAASPFIKGGTGGKTAERSVKEEARKKGSAFPS